MVDCLGGRQTSAPYRGPLAPVHSPAVNVKGHVVGQRSCGMSGSCESRRWIEILPACELMNWCM